MLHIFEPEHLLQYLYTSLQLVLVWFTQRLFSFLLHVYGELRSILVFAKEKLVSWEGLNKVSSLIDKDVIFLMRKLQQTCLYSVLIFLQFMH